MEFIAATLFILLLTFLGGLAGVVARRYEGNVEDARVELDALTGLTTEHIGRGLGA